MIQKNPSQRIERKREQRLQTILQAALELVMEAGLSALTMQKLAERLDYAVGALYRYFKSKDVLLAALQRQILKEFADVMQAADHLFLETHPPRGETLNTPQVQALTRVLLMSEVYFYLPKICPQRFRLLYEMTLSPQPLLGLKEGVLVLQVALPLFQHLTGRFDDARSQGALSPGEGSQRAVLYWASLQGLLPLEKLTRFVPGYDLPQLRQELETTLLLGMGAQKGEITQARNCLKHFVASQAYFSLFASLTERNHPACSL